MKISQKLIKKRIKEMEELGKQGKICGLGMLALILMKASIIQSKGGK